MIIYVISKLFTYIFLPPGIFVFILFLAAAFAKKIRFVFLLSAVVLWMLSTTPVKDLLLYNLENISKHDIKADAVVVLSGGGLIINESKNMLHDLRFLESVSCCHPDVIVEPRSLNTYQNAKFTSIIFEKRRIPKRIYLVSSAYHMKRAVILFKHFGFEVGPKPVGFMRRCKYTWFDFLPQMGNLYKSYKAFHEYFGILSLKLAGIS